MSLLKLDENQLREQRLCEGPGRTLEPYNRRVENEWEKAVVYTSA